MLRQFSLLMARDALPPSISAKPSGQSTELVTGTSIRFDWVDNSSNETGFKVYRRVGTSGPFDLLATKGIGVETHTDSGLAVSTKYCYKVTSFNDIGESSQTSASCQTTPAAGGGGCRVPVAIAWRRQCRGVRPSSRIDRLL